MLLESLVWPPPVDRRGKRTVHGSEEIWERSACLLVSEVERGRELSGTPVSRVNKVHLLIPSSVVRCQHLKTQPYLFLPASVSLYFHAHMNTHTHKPVLKICSVLANPSCSPEASCSVPGGPSCVYTQT